MKLTLEKVERVTPLCVTRCKKQNGYMADFLRSFISMDCAVAKVNNWEYEYTNYDSVRAVMSYSIKMCGMEDKIGIRLVGKDVYLYRKDMLIIPV